jgi:hypothetical protein
MFICVDFPLPDGPAIARKTPSSIAIETSRTACTVWPPRR